MDRKSKKSKNDQDFFKDLPAEITVDIFTRLPPKSILSCKCVCNPWLNLLESPQFVESHISKSAEGLLVVEREGDNKLYKIFEFVDEAECRWKEEFNFNLPFDEPVHSSANGLLLLCKESQFPSNFILCNPLTRDYIVLPSPRLRSHKPVFRLETYGFGVSTSGKYKVVRMFVEREERLPLEFRQDEDFRQEGFECQVYTIGTGMWRRIAPGSVLAYAPNTKGAFLNGNIHWLTCNFSEDYYAAFQISCINLETEMFTTLLSAVQQPENLSVLRDFLCVCENPFMIGADINIWLLKKYDDEKSWTKDFVITNSHVCGFLSEDIRPLRVFEDRDILLAMEEDLLLYYSYKSKSLKVVDANGVESTSLSSISSICLYNPGFHPLRTFLMEDAQSL